LRIIAGVLKGRLFKGPPRHDKSIRPTSDRLRESLFNHLIHQGLDFQGSRGLDLYAGTGALGFEAISRGAERVLWVDQDPLARKIIRKNLEILDLEDSLNRQISKGPVKNLFSPSIASLQSDPILRAFYPVRWVFMDPPYVLAEIPEVVKRLAHLSVQINFFEPKGWLILEVSRQDSRNYPELIQEGLEYFSQRTYGGTTFHCWQFIAKDF